MWTETELRDCIGTGRIEWRKHVLERMVERGIRRAEVIATLANGEIIAVYSEDQPFASALVHGDQQPPLHVVAALDTGTTTCFVITAYRPDEAHFGPDLKTRRPR